MLRSKLISFVNLFLLLPSLLIYPSGNLEAPIPKSGAKKERVSLTYDSILYLVEEIETGGLASTCSPEQLWQINRFIAFLAYEGIRSNDNSAEIALNEDIFELLHEESPVHQVYSSEGNSGFYYAQALLPSTLHQNVQQCSWVSKKWKKTKKFVKKHKTAIIIGAVVVVAATVVVVAVSASSAAAAAAAVGTAAASDSHQNKSPSVPEKEEPPSFLHDRSEETLVQEVIKNKISTVKEIVYEDELSNVCSKQDTQSFGEKARELGGHLAHQAFDEVAEYLKFAPEGLDEIKEFGSKLLPEELSYDNNTLIGNAVENYEKIRKNAHEVIDNAFCTQQAELYAKNSKTKAFSDNFKIGIIPPLSRVPELFSNTSRLIQAGNVVDRAGFTKVGRGLMKHGYRKGSAFPKPTGNPAQINKLGEERLQSIVSHPHRSIALKKTRHCGETIDIYAPELGGARFKKNGEFITFLEPMQ